MDGRIRVATSPLKPLSACPACGAEVLPGSDHCEECGSDLQEYERAEPASKIARTILSDRLSALDPPEPVTATPDECIAVVVQKMIDRRHGAVCIVENDEIVGIFTERDVLMRVAGKGLNLESTPVSKVMTKDPLTFSADINLAYALNQMSVTGLRHLPIVEGKKPVGITTVRGVLNYIAANALHCGV